MPPDPTEWDVFISHASEDKEGFVRPLASALVSADLRVWYDEFTLRVGDSLRRSIDRGLSRSAYGIVVISHSFLAKEWPQKELDGLAAREVDGRRVILPVWHEIDADDVRKYSPLLADRVATSSRKKMDDVVADILKAMGHTPRQKVESATMTPRSPTRRKTWVLRIVASGMIAAVVSGLVIRTKVGELVESNCPVGRVLASELMMESGPDFAEAARIHALTLEQYVQRMERRPLSSILRVLYPEYSPEKRLSPIIRGLLTRRNGGQASQEVLWRAGEQVSQFCMDSEEFCNKRKSASVPDELSEDIERALTKSHELTGAFVKDRTLENAAEVCRANRRAIVLLFLARRGYDNQEKIREFSGDVELAAEHTTHLAAMVEPDDKDQARLLRTYAESEKWRIDILKAMSDGDENRVRELTKKVINSPVEYGRK